MDFSIATIENRALDKVEEERRRHPACKRVLKRILGEIKALIAYLIFSICLYLTALAIFRRKFLSKPFEEPLSPSMITMNGSNWTLSQDISSKQMYLASTFTLIIMLTTSTIVGYFISLTHLPLLFGMLVTGVILRNTGVVQLFLLKEWAMVLRKTAFVVILLRGGLGLDSDALNRLKGACLRLSFIPCSVEATVIAISSHFILKFPWLFAFALGCVLAAVSPAVVVPSMLRISKWGYGVRSGVPTVVIAASAIDDVYAITGFGAFISAAFSKGGILWTITRAPIEVGIGLIIGSLVGVLLWCIPDDHGRVHFTRVALLLQIGTTSMFGTEALGFTSVGPIAVLGSAMIAALHWKKEHPHDDERGGTVIEEDTLAVLWDFALQPILFTSIGYELHIKKIGSLAFKGILIIAIGLVFRTLAAFCATFCSGFKLKEQIFIAFAWIPKATVQAALSPIVLDMAEHESNQSAEHLWEGRVILSVGVLSILISAPLGSFLIHILAPLLLTKDVDAQSDTTKPSPSSTSASQKLSSQKSLTNLSNVTNETTLSISGSSKSNSEFQNGSDEYDDAKVLDVIST